MADLESGRPDAETDKAPATLSNTDTPTPPPKGEAPTPADKPDHGPAIDRAIRRWLAGHIQNSDVSRNTGAYNAVHASLGALRSYLQEEL